MKKAMESIYYLGLIRVIAIAARIVIGLVGADASSDGE
jgi:hypothetical protein